VHLNLREKNRKDTEVAPQRTLSGIDALYFHIEVPYEDYSEFYNKIILTDTLSNSDNFSLSGHSAAGTKQYTYYSVNSYEMESNLFDGSDHRERQLASIGFKNLNQKDNLPSIFVQMSTIAMSFLGYKESYSAVLEVIRGLGIPILGTKVNRLDLNTYVFGHSFDYLRYKLFSTKMRMSKETVGYDTIYNQEGLQTFYLGTRGSSGIYMRIYNKMLEIQSKYHEGGSLKLGIICDKYELKYKEKLSSVDIWNVEFELKREELKRYGIDTVEDVWKYSDSMHKDITQNRIRLIDPKRGKKRECPTSFIWSIISNNYSVFKDNVSPLSPEKCKVYNLTSEQRLINHCNAYLDDVFKSSSFNSSKIQDVKNLIASLSK